LVCRFDVDGGGTLDMSEFKRLLVASGTVENLPSDERELAMTQMYMDALETTNKVYI
jgi:hypothetical protein